MSLGLKRKRDELECKEENPEKKLKSNEVVWRTIQEASLYEMSNFGQVRRIDSQYLLKRATSGTWSLVRQENGVTIKDRLSHSRLFHSCFPEIVNKGASWKQIKDFPNYEVSDGGDVRGPNKNTLKLQDDKGYSQVKLANGQKKKHFFVHTLVALAFIGPKPSENHSVNHKNAVKTDNRVCNLEWATPTEQSLHASETGLVGGPRRDSTKVHKLNMQDEIISTYESVTEAAKTILPLMKTTKLASVSIAIRSICDGLRPTYAGFKWKYAEPKSSKIILDNPEEKWLCCKDAPNYEVSSKGQVRNINSKQAVSFQLSAGYMRVALSTDSKRFHFPVHILVARAFIANDDPTHKTVVDHINGNKQDNRVVNLQWLTPQENTIKGCGRKISKVNERGQVLAIYSSITEAAKTESFALSTLTKYVSQGKLYAGFMWRDTRDDDVVMKT